MQVTVRTEKDTFTVSNVIDWFHGVDSSLIVMSKSEDGKETLRQCWRNWVYFDVVTREDEKPKESEDGKGLLKWADYALRLAQSNTGEKQRHNVTVALTDLEEWAKLAGIDTEYLELTPDSDPEWNLKEACKAIREELQDSPQYSVIPIAIAHLRAVLANLEGEKPEEQASNSEQVPKTVQYAVGDTVVTFEID